MVRQYSWDQAFALVLFPFVIAILAILYVVVVALQGRPFSFASERMRSHDKAFHLLKIRTMHPVDPTVDQSALGGDQMWRVTPIGAFLRRTRLDELPQIFNVLRGDLKFIGPRPPLRKHVNQYPELYKRVLADTRPGITGLATVMVHAREERLLSACRTPAETDAVYRKRCIPIKARLDLIYRDNRGWMLNAMILWMTFSRLFPSTKIPFRAIRLLRHSVPTRHRETRYFGSVAGLGLRQAENT